MKMIIIGLVVGLAVGGGAFFFLKGSDPPPVVLAKDAPAEGAEGGGEEAADEAPIEVEAEVVEEEEETGVEEEGLIFDLDPFVVNLADTKKVRYLKVTVKLDLVRAKYGEDITAHLPQIRDTMLLLLSSKEFADIRSVEGKMELRDEILQRVNAIFRRNKVKMAYFTDFVTQ